MVVLMLCFSINAFALEEEPPVPDDPEEPYLYTREISSTLSISGNTATCLSQVIGKPDSVTKIEITQTLQETFGGISWYYVASWNNTFYDWYAMYTNTKNPISGGNYRVKTVAKVYSGSDYETITFYSTTVTC